MKKSFIIFCVILLISLFSCSKKNKNTSESLLDSLINNPFYIPEEDDGDWVDEVLIQIDDEQIANELEDYLELEDLMKNNQSPKFVQTKEQLYLDVNNYLKFYEYEDELFLPVKDNNKIVMINKNREVVYRRFYDTNNRLQKIEYWNIPDVANSELFLEKNYFYKGDSIRPYLLKTVTKDKNQNFYYDNKGNIIKSEDFIVEEKKVNLCCTTEYTYNKDGLVETKQSIQNNNKTLYKYTYNEDLIDYEIYENDLIRKRHKNISDGEYTEDVYLEENYFVKSYYKDYKKTKEEYYLDNELVREKIYEE